LKWSGPRLRQAGTLTASVANASGDGEGVADYFEWHKFRGSVNIDDMEGEDERDAADRFAA
jgi:hypothetical protein